MEFIPKEIEDYAREISSSESPVLASLNRHTHARMVRPRMLSGHLQGRLLEMISRMLRPAAILEIGTYTGYSAICLAQGLQSGGKLHTIDHNPELEDFTRDYIRQAGLESSIVLHIGEALEVIPTLNEYFDLVFIDADKENYIRYFDMAYEKLRPGGVILADNVLWSGKVIGADAGGPENTAGGPERTSGGPENTAGGPERTSGGPENTAGKARESAAPDPETLGIIRFNQYVKDHPGIINLLLPFRDGLMISMKKASAGLGKD
jgi:caffeoyl-CoA O-methyltransferase